MLGRARGSSRRGALSRRLRVSIEHRRDNENFISARVGLGDPLRLHQQRQPESACENDRGRAAGLADDGGLPRRQPAPLQLSKSGHGANEAIAPMRDGIH
jgi:hypothetical protein